MNLNDALNELGFKPNSKPTSEEVRREYQQLAKFFHPDRNPAEKEVANEFMAVLNEVVRTVRDSFDTKNEWNIESYVYNDVKEEVLAKFRGYEGEIYLEGDGAIYRVNRDLHGTPGRFEGPHSIGSAINEHRSYDWYIQFKGTKVHGLPSIWEMMTDEFEVGLHDFLLKFYQDTGQQIPQQLHEKALGDDKEIRFKLKDGGVDVFYEEFEDGERGLVNKIAHFTQKDISFIEKLALERLTDEDLLQHKVREELQ